MRLQRFLQIHVLGDEDGYQYMVAFIDLNNPRSQPTIPGWFPLAEKHNSFGVTNLAVADLFQ